MSHHYSGPEFGFPHGDARLDLTDLYAFPKPGDAGKSIFIMNVHPSVGVSPPGPTTEIPFATEAVYELKIDSDGDSVADIAYRVRFTEDTNGAQTATLRRVEGERAAGTGDDGQTIVEGAPVSTAREALALVVVGLPNKQIGSELGISEITVKAHRGSMMRKMRAESLAELVASPHVSA